MTSLLCQLGIHNYKQREKFWKEVKNDKGSAIITKEVKYERKRCLRCGKTVEEPIIVRPYRQSPHKKTRNKETRWKDEDRSTE